MTRKHVQSIFRDVAIAGLIAGGVIGVTAATGGLATVGIAAATAPYLTGAELLAAGVSGAGSAAVGSAGFALGTGALGGLIHRSVKSQKNNK